MEMIGPNQAIFDYIGNGYRYVSENDAEAPLGTGSEIHHVASLRGDSSVIQDFSPTENAALNNTRSLTPARARWERVLAYGFGMTNFISRLVPICSSVFFVALFRLCVACFFFQSYPCVGTHFTPRP
jgi:hypothetical protein